MVARGEADDSRGLDVVEFERDAGRGLERSEEPRRRRDRDGEADRRLEDERAEEPGREDPEGEEAEEEREGVPGPHGERPQHRAGEDVRVAQRPEAVHERGKHVHDAVGDAVGCDPVEPCGREPEEAVRRADEQRERKQARGDEDDAHREQVPQRPGSGFVDPDDEEGGDEEHHEDDRVEQALHDERGERGAQGHGGDPRQRVGAGELSEPAGQDVVRHEADAHGRVARTERQVSVRGAEEDIPPDRPEVEGERGDDRRSDQEPDVRLAQVPQEFGGRDVPQRPDEERDGDEDADEDCETASHPRASRTSSDISSTARSIPTSTERLTIEWPMFSSSHSAIAATG